MKKRPTTWRERNFAIACLISVLSLTAITGCGDDTDDPPPNPASPPPAAPAPVPRAE